MGTGSGTNVGDRRAMRCAADMPTTAPRTRPRSTYEYVLASGSRFLTRHVSNAHSEVAQTVDTASVATSGV